MKKTALIFCGILVLAIVGIAQDDDSSERVRFESGSMLLAHPYYLTAEMKQDSLTQDVTLKFTAIAKQKNWAFVLVKLDNPLEEGIVGVKITFTATVPSGIQLCIGLEEEDEVTYEYRWDAEVPGTFKTIVVPLDKFAVGSWCRKADKNQKLDINKVKTVLVGISGDWKDGDGERQGNITFKDVIFLSRLPLKK